MNVIRRVLKTVQYILCQACHSLEILEMVSSRSLVCEIASRICAAPLRPPLHRADLGSLLYRDTGGTKGTLYLASVYCVVSLVYVRPSKVTSGAIVCLFGTAVPVSLSTWHFNLGPKLQPSSVSKLHRIQYTVYTIHYHALDIHLVTLLCNVKCQECQEKRDHLPKHDYFHALV